MGKQYKRWYIVSFLFLLSLLGIGGLVIAEQPGEEKVELVSPFQGDPILQGLWFQRQEAISREESTIGERQLEEIIQRKLDKGIMNLWGYALLVMREGITLEDKDRAIQLGKVAQKLAPDLPYVYFYAGRILWEKERWKVSSVLEKYLEGVQAYTRHLPLAFGQGLNLLFLFGLGVFLSILGFCLLVLLKRMPIYIHALREESKGDVREMLKGGGRIVLFFIPLLLQLNVIWCGLFWCLILWGYLTKGERGVVILSFFLITYLPPIGKALFRFVEGPRAQTVFDIYEATYGERESQVLERLQLWTQGHPRDRDALLALALAFKKEGNYTEAKEYYHKGMDLNPSDADLISNLGNLYVALGEPEKAIALYQRAIEVNPSNGIYYFNLSKALSQKSMLVMQDADRNFQRAKDLNPKAIGAHLEIDSPHPNRIVIDHSISPEYLRKKLCAEFWRETGPSFLILDVWLGGLSPRLPFIFPIIFFVLLIVMSYISYVRRRRPGWWKCSFCGVIGTQTHGSREGRKKICIRCFRILKGKEIDQGLKEKKLWEIKVFQRRTKLYDRLIPLILPGGGHVWKGYNLRGLFFLWIFFVFVGKFYYWRGIVPPAIPSFASGTYGGGALVVVAFAIFYLLVLRGSYKKRGLEIFEPLFWLEGIRR